ncbi:LuxR C-terminal-related transcriptional regulator [Ornithinimicrobium sediminis]|uniref:LuxR C-terminal-related transcriptional regulator n=1 Tax=Ornithinimicrobium sediminis TaxID=2904603 RepID=UPI001E3CD9E9|nr:LuxR C-terminal-related transcriptional regulator [Ornithinimicrobium sediminis]MCE0488313.1 LuxR C-terminal-related transcriptional regulator [Ornithinimicrobium sediminis]
MTEHQALTAAREACGRHDWATARERFHAAGELATDDLESLASACWWLGEVVEYAVVSAELHRRLLVEGRPVRAALVAFELGYTELVRGQEEGGLGWMARARRLFDELPDAPERGFLLAVDGEAAMRGGDLEAARRLATEALTLGEEHDLPTLVALGRFLCGVVDVHRGEVEQGLRSVDEAMLPVREGVVAPEWVGLIYCSTISLCHDLLDLPRAQRWTALTERWCEGHAPAVMFTGICRVHRAQLRLVHGEWTRAEEEAKQAAEDLQHLDVEIAAEAHYSLGELRRLQGDIGGAEAAYRRAHELGRDPLPGMALLCLQRGRHTVAASILDAALVSQVAPLARAPLLAARVEVALAGDDPRHATTYLDELTRIAQTHASPGWQAEARRWHGAVLLARGRHAEAVRELRQACVLWQRMDAPYQVCRIGLDLAVAYEALGDRDTARREREKAAAVLEQLGVPDAGTAEGDLGGLTPRELEVVAAVADGRSNRQAARALRISERTVARHLANVYLKTQVTSRTAAVAWARERGLL